MLSVPLMRWLCAGAVLLVIGHVLTFVAEDQLGIARTLNFPRQFDLNGEGNLAAWYYSFLLLCCAALTLVLTLAARVKGVRLAGRWGALAALFLLMAVDETAQLHDMATGPLRNGLALDFGLLYFAWLIPALLVLGICFVYFAPLARSLPADIRTRFVAAVALYVGGAVGGEMLGGFTVAGGRTSPGYLATITLEESLELAGSLMLISALIALVRRVQPSIDVQVHGSGVSATLVLGPPTPAGSLPDQPVA
jgi:hypothetical protein